MPCCFHIRLYTCLDVLSIRNSIFSVLNLLEISLTLSATAHPWLTKQKSHEIFRFTASTVDIPTGWDPRAKQQPTGLIACGAARRRPVRALPSCGQKEKPEHKRVLVFLGAMEGTRTPGLLIRSARRAIPSIFGSYVLSLFLSDTSQVLSLEFLHPLSDFATICTLCTF